MKQYILLILSVFFVFFSFYPTVYEFQQSKNLPKDRRMEYVHNYVFDYNFYLSRIKEGQPARNASRSEAGGESRWFVAEKYYNKPHTSSLFQILYLYLGKAGGLFNLSAAVIYHLSRIIFGLLLLLTIGKLVLSIFRIKWAILAFLFIVTGGSWPILVKLGNGFRFSTHWGGWSAIDSLQRITFIPHVLLGQIFLVLFVWKLGWERVRPLGNPRSDPVSIVWGVTGLIAGIIFPPVLIVIYTWMALMTALELVLFKTVRLSGTRIIFFVISIGALIYLQVMTRVPPWSSLALFDIQHRSILPYIEYALALGPMLPLAFAGSIMAILKKDRKFLPFITWILALDLLFVVFEHVPQQSPTRFTQMLINVPLGILATYLFYSLWQSAHKYKLSHVFVGKSIRGIIVIIVLTIIMMGLSVMLSMLGWLTDQVKGKMSGTWAYPVGVQLVYPLKDFMDGVDFIRLNTRPKDVILAYEAAGNYIPAYAGNYVYLGHANTPDEDGKLKIAARFFKGEMTADEAKEFLAKENIKYIYFGPQEKDLGNIKNLLSVYPFLSSIYTNSRVTIYK